jgi:hypothetical protein
VPLARPTAWATPTRWATSASKASRSGPAGVIHPLRIAASTYSSSSGPTSGPDRRTGDAGAAAGGAAAGAGATLRPGDCAVRTGASPWVAVGVGAFIVLLLR